MTGSVNWRTSGTFASGDGDSGNTSGIAGGGKLVACFFNISDTAAPGNLSSITNASWSTSPTWTHHYTRQWTSGGVFYSLAWAKAENAYAGNGSVNANWSGTSAVGWAGIVECDSDTNFDIVVITHVGTGTAVFSTLGGSAAAIAGMVGYAGTQTTITWNNSYTEVAEVAETVASVGEVGIGTKVQSNTDEISITLGASNPHGLISIGVFEGVVPPTLQDVVATADANGAATTITMPNNISTGDLLIISATQSAPTGAAVDISGWTKIKGENLNGTTISGNTWAKVAAGSDTASGTSGSSSDIIYIAGRVPVGTHDVSDVSTDIAESTVGSGTSTAPNPPDITTDSGLNYLVINLFHADDDDDTLNFGGGTPYNNTFQEEQADTGTPSHVGWSTTWVTGVSSVAPPNMALAASEEWLAWAMAIPEAAAAGGGTATPDAIAFPWTINDATESGGSTVSATAIDAPWTVNEATESVSSTRTPDAIAAPWTINDATESGGSTITAAVIAWPWTVNDAAASGGGGADGTATPAAIAWNWTVNDAAESAGSTVSPGVISWPWTIQDATESGGSTASPDAIAWPWTVNSPSPSAGSSVAPAVISWPWTVGAPTATGGSSRSPGVISVAIVMPSPSVSAGSSVTPSPIVWNWTINNVVIGIIPAGFWKAGIVLASLWSAGKVEDTWLAGRASASGYVGDTLTSTWEAET